jgi:hypothetical protein
LQMSKTIADTAPETVVARSAARVQVAVEEGLRSIDLSTWQRRTAWLIVALTVIRLAIISMSGLTDTESYYYVWSRFPDWSYYDHPPLIAWMTWVTTLGSKSAFAIRFGPVVYSAVFDALLYRLSARLFSPRAGFIAVVTVAILPAFFVTSFLVNPESLLAPLWVLFLLLLDDLRRGDEPFRPLALGLVIGVGFLAKYTALLEVPVALLFVVTSPEARRWLRRPSFYVAGLVALGVSCPVVAWNFAHHWPSVSLHLSERMPPVTAAILASNALHVAMGQVALFHPMVFPGLIAMLVITLGRARTDERYRLLAWSSAPVLLFLFAVMTRVCDAESHWTMVGYVPLAVAGGGWLDERFDPPSRVWRRYARACIALGAAALSLYVVHARTPVLWRILPPTLCNPERDPLNETLGWDRVQTAIAEEARLLGPDTVVAGAHNVLCGHLAAVLDERLPVYCPSARRTEFDFMGRRTPPAAAPVIYVDTARYRGNPAAVLPKRQCVPAQDINVARDGRSVNEFRIMACSPEPSPPRGAASEAPFAASRPAARDPVGDWAQQDDARPEHERVHAPDLLTPALDQREADERERPGAEQDDRDDPAGHAHGPLKAWFAKAQGDQGGKLEQ